MMTTISARAAASLAAALALGGLAAATLPAAPAPAAPARAARIAVPAGLAESSERIELRGLGGGASGRFRLGQAQGHFSRKASRLGLADPLFVRHKGSGSFAIDPGAAVPALAGRCAYREGQVNVGPVSVTPRRLAYHCAFMREGRPIEGGLVVADPAGAMGRLDGRSVREGMLVFEGRRIAVRSIHRDRKGGLPSPTPLGYLFSIDGRPIGAVDVNGTRRTIFAPASGAEREAVIAGSLALAVFWDPSEVQPDA